MRLIAPVVLLLASLAQAQTYTPPTARERWQWYLKDTYGPLRWASAGVGAGFKQMGGSPPEWGGGVRGYSKRFASEVGRGVVEKTVE
jgi:hypothetical protein